MEIQSAGGVLLSQKPDEESEHALLWWTDEGWGGRCTVGFPVGKGNWSKIEVAHKGNSITYGNSY